MAKRARKHGAIALAVALAALVGCSLVVDTSDIDQGCGELNKLCYGRCVSKADPAYGCELESCSPCLVPNAIPGCEKEKCVVVECLLGFGCDECDAYLLSDEMNCGECHRTCGGLRCSNGICVNPI